VEIEICGSELRASNTIVSSSEGRKNITKIEKWIKGRIKNYNNSQTFDEI